LVFSAVLAFAALPAFSQQGANVRFVAVERAEVRSSTGFFAEGVGTLSLGDEVTVIRDSGRWSEVRAGSVGGWVASASLSPRRTVRAGSAITPGEVALAGRGFGREAENEYGRESGLCYSPVDAMEAVSISEEELRRFIIEGRLARGE